MVSRRRVGLRMMSGIAAVLIALGGAGAALAADHAVAISGFSFSPASVTVTVGDTVTWTNSDAQAHTATANDSSWDTGTIANGASGTITFSTAGTFAYHCSIHSAMTGTVTVQAATGGGATTPPTDTAAPGATDTGSARATLLGVVLVAAAWSIGIVVARRRFVRTP